MSTHAVNIIEIQNILPHENADRLGIVEVGGWSCVVAKDQFKPGDRAVYVEPDYVVPLSHPSFAFLAKGKEDKTEHRMKAVRLRGRLSFGLLIPVPGDLDGLPVGSNVMEKLGIRRYVPPVRNMNPGVDDTLPHDEWPQVYSSKFDLEDLRKHEHLFQPGDQVYVTEKLHGCVMQSARISMADGSRKRICEVSVGESVLGLDDSGRIVPTTVVNTFRNGKGADWVQIKGTRKSAGRGNSEFSITCTVNHKFWNPDRGVYVPASDMKIGDSVSVIRSEMALTPLQEQVLLGKMLGDGRFVDAVTTASIHFGHREEDQGYVEWTCRALGDLDSGAREPHVSGYGTNMIKARSTGSAWIKERFGSFFSADEPKKVPEWVAEALGPIALAFWYMDDGSLATTEGQEDRAAFATCAFTEADCAVLLRALSRLGVEAKYKLYEGYSRLFLSADNAERLFLLIAPYVPPCMQRKLPERYRGGDGWLPHLDKPYKPSMTRQTVTSIDRCEVDHSRYDLETETHNFFANGLLVHNSNSKVVWHNDRLYAGSRTRWLQTGIRSLWTRAMLESEQAPRLLALCQANPDVVFYGEVFGPVQELRYGLKEPEFAIFAANDRGVWWPSAKLFLELDLHGATGAPILYSGPYDREVIAELGERDTRIRSAPKGHMSEGVVIVAEPPRSDPSIGRVALKLISNRYWVS